jgi:hypothetical protein
MDIFSHGLWGLVYAKAMNHRKGRQTPLRLGWSTFWGAFPDLIAFGPSFLMLGWALATGEHSFNDLPFGRGHHPEPGSMTQLAMFQIAGSIYTVSHSAVVFSAVLSGVLLAHTFFKEHIPFRNVLELFPWLIHILMDVPTHTSQFYPTPIFWPLSDWKFMSGITWISPWVWGTNIFAIVILYGYLRFRERRQS